MMAGRTRKPGKREANGRHQRAPAEETAWETKRPVLEIRCRRLGWRSTHENLRAVDKFGGTGWGLDYLAEEINRLEFEAMERFTVLRRSYLLAIGAPAETAKCASIEAGGGRGTAPEDEGRDQAVRAAYDAMARAVGPILGEVRAYGNGELRLNPAIVRALGVMAAHFGVDAS